MRDLLSGLSLCQDVSKLTRMGVALRTTAVEVLEVSSEASKTSGWRAFVDILVTQTG